MSKASSSSPPVEGGANPNHQGTPEDAKPRLTEEEKKQNHIASGKEGPCSETGMRVRAHTHTHTHARTSQICVPHID